jgi:hypothetical protein
MSNQQAAANNNNQPAQQEKKEEKKEIIMVNINPSEFDLEAYINNYSGKNCDLTKRLH